MIEPVTGEGLAEHTLVASGEVSIVDAHYDRPRSGTPRRGARLRTPAEREFLGLGPAGGRAVPGRSAAASVTKLGTEIPEILTLGAAHGTDVRLSALENLAQDRSVTPPRVEQLAALLAQRLPMA